EVTVRKFFLIIGIIIALLIAAVFCAPYFIDVSKYKVTLLDMLEEKTGYRVDIKGEMELSLFPSASLVLHDLTVSPGIHKETTLLSTKTARIHIDLWSLLDNKI